MCCIQQELGRAALGLRSSGMTTKEIWLLYNLKTPSVFSATRPVLPLYLPIDKLYQESPLPNAVTFSMGGVFDDVDERGKDKGQKDTKTLRITEFNKKNIIADGTETKY